MDSCGANRIGAVIRFWGSTDPAARCRQGAAVAPTTDVQFATTVG